MNVKCGLPFTNPNDDVRILNQDEIEIMICKKINLLRISVQITIRIISRSIVAGIRSVVIPVYITKNLKEAYWK